MEFSQDDGTNKLFHEVLDNFWYITDWFHYVRKLIKLLFILLGDPILFYDPYIKFEIGSINGR